MEKTKEKNVACCKKNNLWQYFLLDKLSIIYQIAFFLAIFCFKCYNSCFSHFLIMIASDCSGPSFF